MRTGYLGGSFDPVHLGHLVMADACLEGARLDRVVLVLSGRPPHKRDRALAPARHRLAMLHAAIGASPHLAIDDRELGRSGPSFTIDTVRELVAESDPGDELFWIIGADTLPELTTWKDAERLLDLIPFLTAARPGHDVPAALESLRPVFGDERVDLLAKGVVPMPLMGISSTDLRHRVREGRSLLHLVPEAVRVYIECEGLYAGD